MLAALFPVFYVCDAARKIRGSPRFCEKHVLFSGKTTPPINHWGWGFGFLFQAMIVLPG